MGKSTAPRRPYPEGRTCLSTSAGLPYEGVAADLEVIGGLTFFYRREVPEAIGMHSPKCTPGNCAKELALFATTCPGSPHVPSRQCSRRDRYAGGSEAALSRNRIVAEATRHAGAWPSVCKRRGQWPSCGPFSVQDSSRRPRSKGRNVLTVGHP